MKVLEINSHVSGSTGKIMFDIASELRENQIDVYTSSAVHRSENPVSSNQHIYISSILEKKIHNILRKYTGYNGIYSFCGTKKFIEKIDEIKPDVIHIHNIHSCYVNFKMLFDYIKKTDITVIWTLHDCWTFTGHCVYFDAVGCNQWMEGCKYCEHFDEYPATKVNRAKEMYELKKRSFKCSNIKMLVTPSHWLAGLAGRSFWEGTPIRVINNGIDTSIFRPNENQIRQKLNLQDKFILLGVANPWTKRKGADYILELHNRLDSDVYQIIIVGSSGEEFGNRKGIIYVPRTENQLQLAEYYSAADIFINPTIEDNFPTVNLEALACGTPVITFNTGGSPESIDNSCGIVVPKYDMDAFEQAVRYCKANNFDSDRCVFRSKSFTKEVQAANYLGLYKELLECKNEKGR